MEEIFLTAKEKKELEEKLEFLKAYGRPKIAERVRYAAEYGDISEGGEYDVAKAEQAKIEAEIVKTEAILANAKVVTVKAKRRSMWKGNTEKVFVRRKKRVKFK